MKKNMGKADKAVRIVLAVLFVALNLSNMVTGTAGTVLLVLAAVFLLTSFVSFCPLYVLFGIRTCPAPHDLPQQKASHHKKTNH